MIGIYIYNYILDRVSFRKLSKGELGGGGGGGGGGEGGSGSMMVKDVTKLHKCHLGG